MDAPVPHHVQDAVDKYLQLHAVSKQLEDKMKELRGIIEQFMKQNEVDSISDSNHTGRVLLSLVDRPLTTARYTTYHIDELTDVLETDVLRRCIVEVVDRDRLEALSKLGEIPSDILSRKSTRPSYSLAVRFDKQG